MGMNTIDAKGLQKAFLAGAKGLEAKKDWINELNVFPVPDGDTGTNMTMTIMAAAREVSAIEEPEEMALASFSNAASLRIFPWVNPVSRSWRAVFSTTWM